MLPSPKPHILPEHSEDTSSMDAAGGVKDAEIKADASK
jgi:hypothetical protein